MHDQTDARAAARGGSRPHHVGSGGRATGRRRRRGDARPARPRYASAGTRRRDAGRPGRRRRCGRSRPVRIWWVSRSAPWSRSTWPGTGPNWWRRSPRSARCAGDRRGARGCPGPPAHRRADFAASAAASLRRWYDGTDVDPEQVRRTEATLLANDPDSFLHCYRVFATADAEIGPELDRITVPALAVTGERDPGSTPEMTRRLAEAIARLPSGHRARGTPHAPRRTAPGARRLPVHLHRRVHTCLTTPEAAALHRRRVGAPRLRRVLREHQPGHPRGAVRGRSRQRRRRRPRPSTRHGRPSRTRAGATSARPAEVTCCAGSAT